MIRKGTTYTRIDFPP